MTIYVNTGHCKPCTVLTLVINYNKAFKEKLDIQIKLSILNVNIFIHLWLY